MKNLNDIFVIDLFSGPGGLGEGFFSFFPKKNKNQNPFKMKVSVGENEDAHETNRAFYKKVEPVKRYKFERHWANP